MITRTEVKIDVLGQSILIVAFLLLYFLSTGVIWTNVMLGILGLWQIASAIHLFLAYRYVQKKGFLKTVLVIVISLPVWIQLIGSWAYLPVVGILLWYFLWSVRDMIVVYNRPRSFWDL